MTSYHTAKKILRVVLWAAIATGLILPLGTANADNHMPAQAAGTNPTAGDVRFHIGFGVPYGIVGYAVEYSLSNDFSVIGTLRPDLNLPLAYDTFGSIGVKRRLSGLGWSKTFVPFLSLHHWRSDGSNGTAAYAGIEVPIGAQKNTTVSIALGIGAANLEGPMGLMVGVAFGL